jgi:hypothetical protein
MAERILESLSRFHLFLPETSITSRLSPVFHRIYSPGELQFITTSTYRRMPLFLSDRFRRWFVQRLSSALMSIVECRDCNGRLPMVVLWAVRSAQE